MVKKTLERLQSSWYSPCNQIVILHGDSGLETDHMFQPLGISTNSFYFKISIIIEKIFLFSEILPIFRHSTHILFTLTAYEFSYSVTILHFLLKQLLTFIFFNLINCLHLCGMHVGWHMCGGQRTICKNLFFLLPCAFWGIQLKSGGLAASSTVPCMDFLQPF